MGDAKLAANRPLSPHLSIYRPMLTMLMSIAHRITGFGNAVGFLLLSWWLVAIAAGPEKYAVVSSFFGSIVGRTVLFLFSWGLIHHMLGGIRHLIWDMGYGFELKDAYRSGWIVVAVSLAATIVSWIVGLRLA